MKFEAESANVAPAVEAPARAPEISDAQMAYSRCQQLIANGESNGFATGENSNKKIAVLAFDEEEDAYILTLSQVVIPGAGNSYRLTYYYFYRNAVKFTSDVLIEAGVGNLADLTDNRRLKTAFAYLKSFKHDLVGAEQNFTQNLTDASLAYGHSF